MMSRSGRIQEASLLKLLDKASSLSQVQLLKGDIGSEQDVSQVLQQAEQTMAAIKGVWHAAGILYDHLISDLTRESLERVLLPKIAGTLNLHNCTSKGETHLTHFVLFSSVAALLGAVGQGNYCAANAFMDSFAAYRIGRNQPAISVQWGPWNEIGMAARVTRLHL